MVASLLIELPEDQKINTVRGNLYNVVIETFNQDFILNFENDFEFFTGQQCFSIVQQSRETLGPLFTLLGENLTSIELEPTTLTVAFTGEKRIVIGPDEQYESWQLHLKSVGSERTQLWIGMPGGWGDLIP